MLDIKNWEKLSLLEKKSLLTRKTNDFDLSVVNEIIEAVKNKGDKALIEFSQRFDRLDLKSFLISPAEIAKATVSEKIIKAIKAAIQTISQYHLATKPQDCEVETAKGIRIKRQFKPIAKVGFYVPGGNNTPLISSLLMQAIPANIAGNALKVLCTPANAKGEIANEILVAASLCGIDKIYKLGGAQAIAAMAYGTESIPKVDKIFGPGNRYVTLAKNLVAKDSWGAAIDMPAGPSEVMVVADKFANPAFVASDLLAQAEHGEDSQVFLICENASIAAEVNQALVQQFNTLKRQEIIKESLKQSAILIAEKKNVALSIINEYAPEHLILNRLDAKDWLSDIANAGTIFIGPYAAETLGDYVSGSNHVLPTNGYAKSYSGLSTSDFLKAMTYQFIDEDGVKSLGQEAYLLAMLEGLDGHANAIKQRLDFLAK